MGEDRFIRGGATADDTGPERGLEPTTMLIAALKVEVGRPDGVALAIAQDGIVAGSRIDPHIEGVAAGDELIGGGPTLRKAHPIEDFGRSGVIPKIGAQGGDFGRDLAYHVRVDVRVFVRVKEGDDGHAP